MNLTQSDTVSYERVMLAMADRLFTDYDWLPAWTIFRVIGEVRSQLRDQGTVRPAAEQVEELVRPRLEQRPPGGVRHGG